ncbi:uncharacterized protein LOC131063625 [Cryptomeria japonica]|uniref:uncharacterized protein LOC131063625 n=1 Tax=Cryptomeria japonica TaxID=3369 RepID=UPI0025AC41E9|nr:uncharacterized protein LOC131063625 [Cryptomeria japonica]
MERKPNTEETNCEYPTTKNRGSMGSAEEARQDYEAALSLMDELQEEQSVPQLFKAVRHVFSLNAFVNLIDHKDSHSLSIWKKRVDDLHGQLVSSVVKFLQQFNQPKEQYGNACLSLLYVGAEACERFEKENKTLFSQLSLEREKCAKLNKIFQSQLKDSALKENLELRTCLVVQQQKMIQNEAETRKLEQRLQTALAENNGLHREKQRLAEERKRNLQILERQAAAISQLMDECENNAKEKDQALKSLKMINEDNKILTMNLERHSKVIEDLMNVNAEMIKAANCYAQMHDLDENHPKVDCHSLIDSTNNSHNSEMTFCRSKSDTIDGIYKRSSSAVERSQNSSDSPGDKVGHTPDRKKKVKPKMHPRIDITQNFVSCYSMP